MLTSPHDINRWQSIIINVIHVSVRSSVDLISQRTSTLVLCDTSFKIFQLETF